MEHEERQINPAWLIVARQSRGLTQHELAQLLDVNQGWLSRVESGLRGVSDDKLVALARLLGYPVEFFTQEELVYGRGVGEIFHRKRQDVPNKLLDKIYARVVIRRTALSRLLRSVEIESEGFPRHDVGEFAGTVEDIARAVRMQWGVPRGPVPNLTTLIEHAGGIVIPFDFGTRRIDAMSLWPLHMPPLFFVNIASPGDRLRFTLCHELGHIVMHQRDVNEDMERQADRFAAEFLMPAGEIAPYLANLSLPKLGTLKLQWKVSMAALLMRGTTLSATTPRHAKTLWTQMSSNGFRMREPEELDVSFETPQLYQEILDAHLYSLGYGVNELATILRLTPEDVQQTFLEVPRSEDVRDALSEAESILREGRRRE